MTTTSDERLVGPTPQPTNQPTNDPTEGELLITFDENDAVYVGDPVPGQFIIGFGHRDPSGEFVELHFNGNHHPRPLRKRVDVLEVQVAEQMALIERAKALMVDQYDAIDRLTTERDHVKEALRGLTLMVLDLLGGDDDKGAVALDAFVAFVSAEETCQVCEGPHEGEDAVDFLRWQIQLASGIADAKAEMERLAQEDDQ